MEATQLTSSLTYNTTSVLGKDSISAQQIAQAQASSISPNMLTAEQYNYVQRWCYEQRFFYDMNIIWFFIAGMAFQAARHFIGAYHSYASKRNLLDEKKEKILVAVYESCDWASFVFYLCFLALVIMKWKYHMF